MSYLDLPRICFGGTWTGNVATGNNQPILYWADKNKQPQETLLLDFANVAVLPVIINGASPSDAELRQLMNDEDKQSLQDPRLDGGANWCYWGTNTATFGTRVTSVNLGQGDSTSDPLVGQPAAFLRAELCDSNPAGSQSTQMFFDSFNLAGVELQAPRAFSRWVWFFRNVQMGGSAGASGVFETVLPVSAEQWEALLATGSPAIAALHEAWKGAGNAVGLSLRYGLFASLSDQAGETVNRPGLVSGAIGIATRDELATFPNCRTLYNDYPAPRSLGPTLLQVDAARKVVSVDLFSALPERGKTHDTLAKQDMGTLTLALTDGTGTTTVGTIPPEQYAMTNVNEQGAIVEVSYAAHDDAVSAALDAGWRFMLSSDTQGTLFSEDYWAATDQRNFYLENGETGTLQIKVMSAGKPAAHATVFLQQFVVDYATDAADVGGDAPDPESAWLCSMPATVTTDENGMAGIPLEARLTGNCVIRFTLEQETDAINVLRDGFANVRILPKDDFSTITDEMLIGEAGFKLVYEKVLRFYYITFPVMQPIVDFSNYQVMTNQQVLQMLVTATDPQRWWRYGYMPRTRDLSATRHALLVQWAKVNLKALYG